MDWKNHLKTLRGSFSHWKGHLKTVRGNLSLWSLGLSVFLFKAWQWYFAYPAETEVAVLGGVLRLKVGYLSSLVTFVFGWLVGVYSLKNLQKMMVHFFRPLGLVTDPDAQEFFSAPATLLFSLALLVFVADTVTANIALAINSRYEVFLALPKGSNSFLILPDGKTAERTNLKPGQTVRIALRGRADSQVLLVRDQYNLITVDALSFTRGRLGVKIGSPPLVASHPQVSVPGLVRNRKAEGLFGIELTGPLRYSPTKVAVTITPLKDEIKSGGWLQPGTGTDCPERSGPAYSRRFLKALCDNRGLFSEWETVPAYHEKLGTVVYHSIGQYDLAVRFEKADLQTSTDSFQTREADEIIAVEKEVKQ